MPTENRRVATYLPKEIDSAFKAFKDERGIGDSAALILILCERLGVTHSVNQVDYSRFATVGQLEELAAKVAELAAAVEKSNAPSNLLDNLPNEIKRLAERLDRVEPYSSILPSTEKVEPIELETVAPGQMDLLEFEAELPTSELQIKGIESGVSSKSWMTTKECWEYLNKPVAYSTFRKYSPMRLQELYNVEFDLERKALTKSNSRWLRPPLSAKDSGQVSPVSPLGLESSEEG